MIIMIYRTPKNIGGWFNFPHSNFTAVALLSDYDFSLNFDGVQIFADNWISTLSSGITVQRGLSGHISLLPKLAHEYGHYLFGAGHNSTDGMMTDPPKYSLNAWERERLGYLSYTNCSHDGYEKTLADFVENGDVLRIPVPITNQNSSTYFLVENHQRLSNYDQIISGGSLQGGYNFNTNVGSGIYVWLIKNGGSSSSHSSVQYEAVTADGRWNWSYEGNYYAGPGWYVGKSYEGYLPKTKRSTINRNTGKSDRNPKHIYWNSHWASKWIEQDPHSEFYYTLNRNVMGDEFDAFNIGYNETFTPWSNPSTYVQNNTNISLQVICKNGSNIDVKVYTTETSALALPPSKPQNLKVTSNGTHPRITWEANTEPDLFKYWLYRSDDNGSFYRRAIISSSSTSYVDNEVVFTKPIWEVKVQYKILAVDNTNKKSVFSNTDYIYGDANSMPKKDATEDSENIIIDNYRIAQNYPNPFNPSTTISYQLPKNGLVVLKVYNTLGKEVRRLVDEYMSAGSYTATFDALNLPSGVYYYQMKSGDFNEIKKMIYLK